MHCLAGRTPTVHIAVGFGVRVCCNPRRPCARLAVDMRPPPPAGYAGAALACGQSDVEGRSRCAPCKPMHGGTTSLRLPAHGVQTKKYGTLSV